MAQHDSDRRSSLRRMASVELDVAVAVSEKESSSSFLDMPIEVHPLVAEFLDLPSFLNYMTTCKRIYHSFVPPRKIMNSSNPQNYHQFSWFFEIAAKHNKYHPSVYPPSLLQPNKYNRIYPGRNRAWWFLLKDKNRKNCVYVKWFPRMFAHAFNVTGQKLRLHFLVWNRDNEITLIATPCQDDQQTVDGTIHISPHRHGPSLQTQVYHPTTKAVRHIRQLLKCNQERLRSLDDPNNPHPIMNELFDYSDLHVDTTVFVKMRADEFLSSYGSQFLGEGRCGCVDEMALLFTWNTGDYKPQYRRNRLVQFMEAMFRNGVFVDTLPREESEGVTQLASPAIVENIQMIRHMPPEETETDSVTYGNDDETWQRVYPLPGISKHYSGIDPVGRGYKAKDTHQGGCLGSTIGSDPRRNFYIRLGTERAISEYF